MNNLEGAQDVFQHFMSLSKALGGRVQGWERSAKFTPNSFSDQRWLFGFDKQQLSWAELSSQPYFSHLPVELISEIESQWDRANFCYCALDMASYVLTKFYLEFPVLLSTQTSLQTHWAEPAIWCMGYKFNHHLLQNKQTHYYLLPGFSVARAFDQAPMLHAYGLSTILTRFLEKRAPTTLESIDILRLSHVSEAQGLDFRLYDLNLRVSDWVDYLNETPHKLEWIMKQQAAWLNLSHRWGHSALGHLSLGVGEDQEPYINLYWATDENE